MAKFTLTGRETVFEVANYDSLESINEKLLAHCIDTMDNNAPNIVNEYPVYENNTQIGWVQLSLNSEEDTYVIKHFTLDRKELSSDWNPHNFYRGIYGLNTENES
ncbi:hypothetical protein [Vibrio parahaemolyticus]